MRNSFFLSAALAAVIVFGSTTEEALGQPTAAQPSAADRDTARKLLDDGDDAFAKKDFPSALKAYSAAHAIMHVPSTGVAVAKAQMALGLLLEARDTALEVTRMAQLPLEPTAFAEARKQASDLAAQLDTRIPSLEVEPTGVPAGLSPEISIDGAAIPAAAATLPRRVNPGGHKVLVRAPGFSDGTADVTVVEGEKRTVPVELVALASSAPPKVEPKNDKQPKPTDTGHGRMSVLLPVGIATTGVGLVVGLGTGIAALGNKGCKANHNCGLAWGSDVGFGVAVVGAALTTVGIVLTLKEPKPGPNHTEIRMRPVVGAGYLGITGEY